jgi:nitroimidazol reductase NimA-like FMN-containing flavoprotein (pyridoxamine 5'-phosphate oxidase superfamily)
MPTLNELAETTLPELTSKVRFVTLATVSEEGPVVRSLGSWGLEGQTVYFSTARTSDKVSQLAGDPRVSLQLLEEGQEIGTLRNLVVDGSAKELRSDDERAPAIDTIGKRNPRFKERAAKGELGGNAIFAVKASKIKILDFSKGPGANTVTVYQG